MRGLGVSGKVPLADGMMFSRLSIFPTLCLCFSLIFKKNDDNNCNYYYFLSLRGLKSSSSILTLQV